MDLKQLFLIQQELDQKIVHNHKLQGEDLVPSKLLALQVELGELANETRCFKFWSMKPASAREIILEEFVDGLHFILSIGLDLSFEEVKVGDPLESKQTPVEAFIHLFEQISIFSRSLSLLDYEKLFQQYIQMGKTLGFEWSDIVQAYLDKNEINHRRQAEGY